MVNAVTTTNPTTEVTLDRYAKLNDSEVDAAVEACHRAQREWGGLPLERRGALIGAIGERLRAHREPLAKLMTAEMGKLLKQSYQEIDLCIAICAYTAEHGPRTLQDERRELSNAKYGLVTYRPLGVIFGIQPWNYPAYQVVRYSIASLMAGNGVLLKHAACVTGSGEALGRIYRDAGLPDHLFRPLVIDHDQASRLIEHPLVRGVTLTGSDAAGRKVAQQAAGVLKKTVMELGSNDAYLVLEDADLELAVKRCVAGRIYNNGETCIAAKRFIVVDAIYDRFREAFVQAMSQIRHGDPMGDEVELGPIARQDLRERLDEQVRKSVAHGARVLCGGAPVKGTGFFYPATVVEHVQPGQPAYDDELFGPVASLIRAGDAQDAMRIANDSRYGLGGGIFTQDEDRAIQLASQHFDTGMVFINGFGLAVPDMPFGGVKSSGWGREHGTFGMREFVNVKSLMIMS